MIEKECCWLRKGRDSTNKGEDEDRESEQEHYCWIQTLSWMVVDDDVSCDSEVPAMIG